MIWCVSDANQRQTCGERFEIAQNAGSERPCVLMESIGRFGDRPAIRGGVTMANLSWGDEVSDDRRSIRRTEAGPLLHHLRRHHVALLSRVNNVAWIKEWHRDNRRLSVALSRSSRLPKHGIARVLPRQSPRGSSSRRGDRGG